jgi:putative ABC transport system substrate-binding protein
MKRRDFIITLGGFILGGTVTGWPLIAHAQQRTKIARLAVLSPNRADGSDASRATVNTLIAALHQLGYTEGQNIAIERRFAESNPNRLHQLAAELVERQVDVIVALSTPAARAAKQATSLIPIVAIAMADPVEDELVASLARPGGMLPGQPLLARSWSPSAFSCSERWCRNCLAWLCSGIPVHMALARRRRC